MQYLIVALVLVGTASPALADFYISHEKSGTDCKVVETRPADTETTVVVGIKVYKSREEAESDIKTVCKTE